MSSKSDLEDSEKHPEANPPTILQARDVDVAAMAVADAKAQETLTDDVAKRLRSVNPRLYPVMRQLNPLDSLQEQG